MRKSAKHADLILGRVKLSSDQAKVIVAPGAGRFQPRDRDSLFNFIGDLSDFYMYIMFELSRLLAEVEAT